MGSRPGHSRRPHRAAHQADTVSRGANILIVGGVVAATWSLTDDQIVTAWFGRARPPEREALEGEVARIAKILNRPLKSTVQTT